MNFGTSDKQTGLEIAIIGMAGRFPGANNIDEFWQNLRDGVESISFFSDQELLSSGIAPALLHDPNYVKARGILTDIDLFDFLKPCSIAEAGLRFVLCHDISSCCVGMRSPNRVSQNLKAIDPPYLGSELLMQIRNLFGGIQRQVR